MRGLAGKYPDGSGAKTAEFIYKTGKNENKMKILIKLLLAVAVLMGGFAVVAQPASAQVSQEDGACETEVGSYEHEVLVALLDGVIDDPLDAICPDAVRNTVIFEYELSFYNNRAKEGVGNSLGDLMTNYPLIEAESCSQWLSNRYDGVEGYSELVFDIKEWKYPTCNEELLFGRQASYVLAGEYSDVTLTITFTKRGH